MSPQRDDLQNELTVMGFNCDVLSDLLNSPLERPKTRDLSATALFPCHRSASLRRHFFIRWRVSDSPFPLGGNDLRLEFVAIGGGRVH